MMRKGYLIILLAFINYTVQAQFLFAGPYSQDFNGLGTGNSTAAGGDLNIVNASLNGWFFSESGSAADFQISAGTGSSTTGDTYNFGSAAAADRTLGGLLSGSLNPTIGFYVTNNTGSTITSLTISYTGEQWRLGALARPDRLDFQYSLNATSLTTGTWVDANALDFTAPVTAGTVGQLDGNLTANRATINAIIKGLNIANGATFFLRWNDLDATSFDDGLGIDDFSLTASNAAASTDYFRSITSGNWSDVSTWESSINNATWVPATDVPTSAANTIIIQSGHTVSFAAFISVDQIVIATGGTLDFVNGIMIVNDGAGDDIDIQNSGALVLSFANNPPAFIGGVPTVNIRSNGILRVSASGMTSTAGAGVHAANYVYRDQSILEYTLTSAFGTVGVTYFPNVSPTTIPTFRITQNIGVFVGSSSNTVINGLFEANGNVNFANSGTKTFRNGITGSGNIGCNATSGKFIINGTATSILGGLGSLTVPLTGGLEIGAGTDLIITTNNKTVTGDISLAGPGSLVDLYLNNLVVSGIVTGGSSTSYINTTLTGMLTLNSITTTKIFPIGNGSYNPISITNGGSANYSARVAPGINPGSGISFPTYGINRTWDLLASTPTPGVTVSFQYASTDANAGALPQPRNMEILQNSGSVWNILPGNVNIAPGGADPALTVTTTAAITINNSSTPYALGITGGWILPLDCIISCEAKKVSDKGIITFDINTCAQVNSFEVQRSLDGTNFKTIAVIPPDINQVKFNYTDAFMQKGINQYRIKVNRQSGSIKYSNTVAIINDAKGLLITSVTPNPVHNQAIINISSAKQTKASFQVFNLSGHLVKQWQTNLAEGTNNINIDVAEFPAGIYNLLVSGSEGKTVFRFAKQ